MSKTEDHSQEQHGRHHRGQGTRFGITRTTQTVSALACTAAVMALSLVLVAPAAGHTQPDPPPAPPTVQLLSRGTVADPFAVRARGIALAAERPIDVAIARLTFAVDGSTGWHKHPGPTVVTVIAGELTVTDPQCQTAVYEVGDSFVEQGPRRHLAVNTAGTTTVTNVMFFVPQRAPALTVPVAPPRCAD